MVLNPLSPGVVRGSLGAVGRPRTGLARPSGGWWRARNNRRVVGLGRKGRSTRVVGCQSVLQERQTVAVLHLVVLGGVVAWRFVCREAQ